MLKHVSPPPPIFVVAKKNTSMPQSRTARPLEGLRENPEYNGEYLRERDVPKCVEGVETRFEIFVSRQGKETY